jgi:hypothetical protein
MTAHRELTRVGDNAPVPHVLVRDDIRPMNLACSPEGAEADHHRHHRNLPHHLPPQRQVPQYLAPE